MKGDILFFLVFIQKKEAVFIKKKRFPGILVAKKMDCNISDRSRE